MSANVTLNQYNAQSTGFIEAGTTMATVQNGDGSHSQRVVVDGVFSTSDPLTVDVKTSTTDPDYVGIVDEHGHWVNVQQISAVTDGTEYGLLAIAMLHGQDPHGEWKDVKVSHTGALTVEANDGGGSLTVDGIVTANQGTAGATAWKVDGSGVTQPVSGTVAVSGISGTVALPTGAATSANQTNGLQKVQLVDADGDVLDIFTRTQTPGAKTIAVSIGAGDIISNLPVVMQYDHHQIHEGESHRTQDAQVSLGTSTVKYSLTVPVYANTIQAPHLIITADVYNGAVLVQMYEGATFTGGVAMTSYNRNRNSATTPGLAVKTGVTSTNGTLIDSFYVGAGSRASASNRAAVEWVLKSNTIYRVDVIGQVAGTACIIGFDSYEDLGV